MVQQDADAAAAEPTTENKRVSDFGLALAYLRGGRSVRREIWKNVLYVMHIDSDSLGPMLVAMRADGMVRPWMPSLDDLLANDWEVV